MSQPGLNTIQGACYRMARQRAEQWCRLFQSCRNSFGAHSIKTRRTKPCQAGQLHRTSSESVIYPSTVYLTSEEPCLMDVGIFLLLLVNPELHCQTWKFSITLCGLLLQPPELCNEPCQAVAGLSCAGMGSRFINYSSEFYLQELPKFLALLQYSPHQQFKPLLD